MYYFKTMVFSSPNKIYNVQQIYKWRAILKSLKS